MLKKLLIVFIACLIINLAYAETPNANINSLIENNLEEPLDNLDTDDDGIKDFIENKLGTDPKDMDTDKDGYSDGVEVDLESNPLDKESNPGNQITSFSVSKVPAKNYLVGLLVLTIIAQIAIFSYLRRTKSKFVYE